MEETHEFIRPGSHPRTNDRVMRLLFDELKKQSDGKVLDLGAGRGHLSTRISNQMSAIGMHPAQQLMATDLYSCNFQAENVPFREADFNFPLPFENGEFSVVVSVEVLEHLRSPYDLLADCFRILRPGGLLLASTPNVLHLESRLSFLTTGFHELFDPPSLKPENAGRLCGHIMPLSLPYYNWGLKKAGFSEITFTTDRTKKKSAALVCVLYPILALRTKRLLLKMEKKDRDLYIETREAVKASNNWTSLTSRSLIFAARKT